MLLLGGVLAACGGTESSDTDSAPKQRPNVLLLVVDTLRQDHLSPYGAVRRTPGIADLAEQGITVDGLRACTAWTMPSMATLFTGLAPAQHGVMRMRGVGANLTEPSTLARSFQQAGYTTACVMSNFLLLGGAESRGFDLGFDHYDDAAAREPLPHRGSTAAMVAASARRFLEGWEAADDSPWFLTAHFFDPHTSYEDHPEFEFTDRSYEGWVRGGLENRDYRTHQESATAMDRAQLAALYDEEIHAVGVQVEGLLAALAELDELGSTVVIFTADHGEELAERGYIGHTRTLHFEQVNLPLLVRLPAAERAGQRLTGPIAQQDLFATILDLAGVEQPRQARVSFANWLRGGAWPRTAPSVLYFETDFVPVVDDPDKRILMRGLERWGSDGRPEAKYVLDRKRNQEFLWLQGDESVNRAGEPHQSGLLQEMRSLMNDHDWYQP